MHYTYGVLVHVPTALKDADAKKLTKEEITSAVINHAEEETNIFEDIVFDYRDLLVDEDEIPNPVVFSNSEKELFDEYIKDGTSCFIDVFFDTYSRTPHVPKVALEEMPDDWALVFFDIHA